MPSAVCAGVGTPGLPGQAGADGTAGSPGLQGGKNALRGNFVFWYRGASSQIQAEGSTQTWLGNCNAVHASSSVA